MWIPWAILRMWLHHLLLVISKVVGWMWTWWTWLCNFTAVFARETTATKQMSVAMIEANKETKKVHNWRYVADCQVGDCLTREGNCPVGHCSSQRLRSFVCSFIFGNFLTFLSLEFLGVVFGTMIVSTSFMSTYKSSHLRCRSLSLARFCNKT